MIGVCHCGAKMIKAGYGKYPYDCTKARKHPNAMVYMGCEQGHTGWEADVNDNGSNENRKANQ
jgi:hypothetical protein